MSGKFWSQDGAWSVVAGCSGKRDGVCKVRSCWAETLVGTRLSRLPQFAGLSQPTTMTTGSADVPRWTSEARFFPEALSKPLHWRRPRIVAPGWLGDPFDPGITDEQIAAMYGIMSSCPQHTFLVTTKRPERRREWHGWVNLGGEASLRILQILYAVTHRVGVSLPIHHGGPWPLQNVWEGVSICDQPDADKRIPVLIDTPAAQRWVIAEPLLGPVLIGGHMAAAARNGTPIEAVVVGAETGHGARPCDPEMIRSIVRQCRAAGVPCWTKAGLDDSDPCYQRRLPWAT